MLILPSDLRDQLIAAARAAAPNEACGLLEGCRNGADLTVTAVHPAANLSPAPQTGFAIDPAVQFALQRRLRGSGRDIIGCYHSHPGGRAEPSRRDRDFVNWGGCPDGFVWIILAGSGHSSISAFQGPQFHRLEILIVCA